VINSEFDLVSRIGFEDGWSTEADGNNKWHFF